MKNVTVDMAGLKKMGDEGAFISRHTMAMVVRTARNGIATYLSVRPSSADDTLTLI